MIKRVIKSLIPPIFIKLYVYVKMKIDNSINFKTWWNRKVTSENIHPDLIVMVNAYIDSPAFLDISKYWIWLNKKNIQQIIDSGYSNFRQTVSKNYFTNVSSFEGWKENAIFGNLLPGIDKLNLEVPLREIMRKHEQFSLAESIQHNTATALLYEHVQSQMHVEKLILPEEPLEGEPPYILINNRRVTQDCLNSALEYLSISHVCEMKNINRILELGAGFGRTSFYMMKMLPNVKYIVMDIPPALFISQTYLASAFPERKVFKFRPFNTYDEVQSEFESADLCFIMPSQIDIIRQKSIDLFLAIDCLHEMTKAQIDIYFEQAEKLSQFFYFKCWKETIVNFDNIFYAENDYPVKPKWEKLFNMPCTVPSAYFEACYKIN